MLSKNMIFRNTLFGVAVCLAGVLTACAEKELNVENPVVEEGQVEICFAPTVGADITTKGSDIQPLGETGLYLRTIISENTANPFDEVATRATMVNGFDPDGAEGTYPTFTVYSFLHDGTWAENSGNATPYINGIDAVSLGNGYWGFEESVFWPAWDTNMTFLSYAAPDDSDVDISFTADDGEGGYVYATPTLVYSDPAVAELDSDGAITDAGLKAQYDLLVAQTPDLTKETTTIPMSFSHVFASVQFLCGNMSGGTITKLSLVNIAHKGVYDFGTGTWEVDTDDRTEYVFPLEVTVAETEEDVDIDAGETMDSYDTNILGGSSALMMLPQDLTGCALLLEYTPTDDEEPMELAIELSGEWEAGAHITYHISFLAGDDDILPYLTGSDGIFAAYALANFDTDKDGHISQKEADAVTEIICGYYPTADDESSTTTIDFTGIEHFTKLEKFTSNRAKTLDLSQNSKLTYVMLGSEQPLSEKTSNIYASSITSINLSNTALTELPDYAFRGCTSLQTVELPESLEKIGDYAFYGVYGSNNASSLQKLDLPASVTEIGKSAFYDCRSLKEINIEETKVTELKDSTFYRCTKQLDSITLPDGITKIGKSVFQSCATLVTVNMPAYLKELGEYAFSGCSVLNPTGGIAIPESVTEIGGHAFYGCSKLASVTLPSTLVTIGSYAFGCSSSSSPTPATFTMPEDGFTALTTIGDHGFYYCTGLTSFPLPSTLTSIGDYAFSGCSALASLGDGLPEKLETLGASSFQNCAALAVDVVIPEGITAIGANTFSSSGILSVDMNEKVTAIGDYAFSGCSSMTAMLSRASTPPSTGTQCFAFTSDGPTVQLYVYEKDVDTYKSSTYSAYTNSSYFISGIKTIEEYESVVPPTGNYDTYTNGGGITIGDKTYTAAEYGEATLISSSNSSFVPSDECVVYFIEPDAEVTYAGTANLSKLILIGNDPTQKSKVTTGSTQIRLAAGAELVFSNLDLDFSGESSYPIVLNVDGAAERLAFDGCHVTASSSNNTAIAYTSSTARYFNEILISDCVWNMPANSSTEYLVQIAEGNTNTQKSFTLTNNVFYSSVTESDFRIVMAKGMTFTDVVYKNNTLVNLAASANGVFEYGYITNVDAEWNLTYDESLTTDYVFFRPSGTSDVPTGTVKVENNIAYRGTDTTYGWYWFYGEESGSWTAPSGFTACTVLTESPFDELDVSTETFTVNSTYSGYGYQTN